MTAWQNLRMVTGDGTLGGVGAGRSARDRGRLELAVPLAAALCLAAGATAAAQLAPGGAPGVEPNAENDSWLSADPGYVLVFPRDHAAHPDHRIEWWYYTGNLEVSGGRRFGYQVTFFRAGIDRRPVNPSRWAVRDLYMAHLAVTDVARGEHHVAERLNRAGVGWAGADPETLHVWNDGWSATLEGGAHRLVAASDDGRIGVDLRLESAEPVDGSRAGPGARPVLHGDNGYSRKGAETGNASHYYSLTRLPTIGRIVAGGESFEVTGSSWMDHEFGSSFLEPAQAGWDWLSIQLDDGTDLMLYTMRRLDGSADPWSSGTVVAGDGVHRLRAGDYRLVPGRRWTSPDSGAAYPVEWRITVPALGIDLRAEAALDAQELRTGRSTGVTYWEGAIDVRGTRGGAVVTGRGYLEMTGYAGPPLSRVLR